MGAGTARDARAGGGSAATRPGRSLDAGDVTDIRALKGFVASADRSTRGAEAAYVRDLSAREADLRPAALHAWRHRPSGDLSAELRRWHPRYRIERTRSGYRAFRWVARRGRYASRPTVAGLDAAGIAPYAGLVRH